MILAIKKSSISIKPYVQQEIDLERLIIKETKFFDDEECAEKEGYIPLYVLVSIRTIYTNKVVEIKHDYGVRYYKVNSLDDNLNVDPIEGYNYLYKAMSKPMMELLNKAKDTDYMFRLFVAMNSQPLVMGLYYSNKKQCPIIYAQVIFNDNSVNNLGNYVEGDCRLIDIKDMKDEGGLVEIEKLITILKEK
jgi:hypothetical protein